jgi:hypothetical protein
VRPPRKAWKAIGNLSGGEKTLSSLALVFALHHIKPTPVYVLDEIDAALDFRNVAIVGRYILERGIGAQFIIISLRNNMFELAHQIVGISKVADCTRSIVISPKFLADRIALAVRRGVNAGGARGGAAAGAVASTPGGGAAAAAARGPQNLPLGAARSGVASAAGAAAGARTKQHRGEEGDD